MRVRTGLLTVLAACVVVPGWAAPGSSADAARAANQAETEAPPGCVQPAFEPSTPVPPLYACDEGGADQDAVWGDHAVDSNDPFLTRYFGPDGKEIKRGYTSTRGAADYEVTTMYLNEDGEYVAGPSYSHDFDLAESGEEAVNRYDVQVSDRCFENRVTERYRKVDAFFTNVKDATGRRKYSVFPGADHDEGDSIRGTNPAFNIADGQTIRIPIGRSFGESDGLPGLRPGNYDINFYESDTRAATGTSLPDVHLKWTKKIRVEACSDVQLQHPAGSVTQLPGTTKMRVIMKNRANHSTAFRLRVNPRRGANVTRRYSVAPGATKSVVYADPKKAKKGTEYSLEGQVTRSGRPDWKTLAVRTAR